jgi:arginine exporter protein ArgO
MTDPHTLERPKVTSPARRYDGLISVVVLAFMVPAVLVGLIIAVSLGFNLGPALTGRQRVGILLGALVASIPPVVGLAFGLRGHRTAQRGGTAGVVLNGLVALAVWGIALFAIFE